VFSFFRSTTGAADDLQRQTWSNDRIPALDAVVHQILHNGGIHHKLFYKMIKGIIIVNNHGNPRLAKFYQTVEGEAAQQQVIRSIFQQVSRRPDSFCNYLEGQTVPNWGSDVKLIYRHYATLYFVFAVDSQESDLGILDLIQVFVECLDKCFENVCELDLIFGYPQLNNILDEIVSA
jgi:AP-3 complex subunit sigma